MNTTLRRSLPPLNALRAFEAAARHLSPVARRGRVERDAGRNQPPGSSP
jgi:hypothetical protein